MRFGETSQAVSSTLDLQEVLDAIVSRAVELSETDGGSIFEFDPAGPALPAARVLRHEPNELEETLRAIEISLDETFLGRGGQRRRGPPGARSRTGGARPAPRRST